ncbi:hypothetical protein HMPREF3038_01506 [Akkermansia sp. KLE1797]|nr:hypothetical protein HMPREF3038_01506 [Akkermansia sp. KLE1797]KXU53450.1 hypothetical protein HMPREF3039_02381 [Akkermansia sp. KLE1798]
MAVAPSRVRGLKLCTFVTHNLCMGRTLTGAWIETGLNQFPYLSMRVAPSRVRGLKHPSLDDDDGPEESHPHGCVD